MSNITCAVLIGHDLGLLRWCVENARARAGMEHEWLVVNWEDPARPAAGPAIRAYCEATGLAYTSYMGEPRPLDPAQRTGWFLRNLYKGWNEMYACASTPWVVRMGSDQFWSDGWLAWMWEAAHRYGDWGVYHCHTVESPVARHSRHRIMQFGSTLEDFDAKAFDADARHYAHQWESRLVARDWECGLWYRHPARGTQVRPDGVSWLQSVGLWRRFGPLPDAINAEGVTGDVAYMDTLYDAGVPGYVVMPAVSYHLVRGESRDVQE